MIMTIMLMVVELTMMMVIIYDHSNILKSSLKIQVQWATKVVERLLENDAFGY